MAAPTPVSAYLHSATMVKAGIFLLARVWPALAGTEAWFLIVTATGLVTMLIAAWIAIFKDDLKALLAFSTVSHLGLVTMLFGFGTPLAAVAGIFHIINHATFKCALFMTAGIVDHETHTRDARRLGGLIHLMPITGTLALIAAASMAGVPPLNGFISKEMMLEEAVAYGLGRASPGWCRRWRRWGRCCRPPIRRATPSMCFSAVDVTDYPHTPHDPPAGMWLPVAVLVSLVVVIGLLPTTVAGPIVRVAAAATVGAPLPDYHLALWHGFNLPLLLSMIGSRRRAPAAGGVQHRCGQRTTLCHGPRPSGSSRPWSTPPSGCRRGWWTACTTARCSATWRSLPRRSCWWAQPGSWAAAMPPARGLHCRPGSWPGPAGCCWLAPAAAWCCCIVSGCWRWCSPASSASSCRWPFSICRHPIWH